MALGTGFGAKAAFRKEGNQTAFGTPVACGAGHQMPIIPPVSLVKDIKKQFDNQAQYKGGHGAGSVLLKATQGQCTFQAVYRGLEQLMACAMGFSHYPETIATGVYKHRLILAENMHTEPLLAGHGILAGDGYLAGDSLTRRGTLCIDKDVSPIWEYISTMIRAMTIKGNAAGVRISFDMVPQDLDLNSSTNTASSAWSIANGDWDYIRFQDLDIWIDDYSISVPLASADAIGISQFEINLTNNLKVKKDSQSGNLVADSRRDKKRRVAGSFTMPRYESDTLLDKLGDQTACMAMLRFTGPEIGATGYYLTLWLWLPNLKFDVIDAPLGGRGIIPVTHTFTCEIPAAVPSGFPPGADKELYIQIQNDLSTNPLTS